MILIFIGLGVFLVASKGYYPILIVNGRIVSAKTFWDSYQASARYYQTLIIANKEEIEIDPDELKKAILNQIIENILIDQKAQEELGDELASLVQNRIAKVSEGAELKEAAKAVYGLSFKEFEKQILIPVAKQEILSGRLFLQGKDIEQWLIEAKKESNVRVFSSNFLWDGSKMQLSNNSK